MVYLLKKIKRQIITVFTVLLVSTFISGCGTRKVTDAEASTDNSVQAIKTDVTSLKAENKTITDTTIFNKVPIYGKKQKAKIKKYLSTLPDEITVKEAKKKGIIISSYNNKINKRFQKDWMDFYKYVKAGEKEYSPKYEDVTCYAEPHNKRAIVLLAYTVEGDACYTYLSFIKGKYFVLSDSSRDKYKAGSWDGYSDLMVYKSLRKYRPYNIADMKIYNLKKDEYSKRQSLNKKIEFYLFKKQDITRKKVIKIINGGNSYKYAVDYYNIYQM